MGSKELIFCIFYFSDSAAVEPSGTPAVAPSSDSAGEPAAETKPAVPTSETPAAVDSAGDKV